MTHFAMGCCAFAPKVLPLSSRIHPGDIIENKFMGRGLMLLALEHVERQPVSWKRSFGRIFLYPVSSKIADMLEAELQSGRCGLDPRTLSLYKESVILQSGLPKAPKAYLHPTFDSMKLAKHDDRDSLS